MSENKGKKLGIKGLLSTAAVLAVGMAGKRHEDKYWEKVQQAKGPDIARRGEIVVAVENVTDGIIQVYPSHIYNDSCKTTVCKREYVIKASGIGVDGICVNKGTELTVKAYDLERDAYQFEGLENKFWNPNWGEHFTLWYPSRMFKREKRENSK